MIDIHATETNDIETQQVLDDAFDLGMKMLALAFSVPASLILPDEYSIKDMKGNHCPETPTHTMIFNGAEVKLCERCYENVLLGAYGKVDQERLSSNAVRSL